MRYVTAELKRMTARLPQEQVDWLKQKAAQNLTSLNAEISRSIRVCREAEQASG